ncbi:DUF3500 domain-containing protein [Knoellia sp. DB2414S]|uniref:DUF3500 domain-containing protein n=2 Tax=Knoellia koreensis TaxID=2730921 RepID=A0A849HDW6_9MICO|nr:DUF3500 domain-containing protein [Knoellia sp. DB2414S]
MRAAAAALADALDPDSRARLATTLDDPAYREWTYLPGPRDGAILADMTEPQRDLALALLDTGCSATSRHSARAVIDLDIVRRQLGGGNPQPGDDRFWWRVIGDPARDDAWAWRVNGHHLAIHVTVVGDDITVTPSFFGSEPATVLSGPRQGLRVLTAEEDLARDLLATLDADQQAIAVTSDEAPDDILTRNDPVADDSVIARGIARADLRPDQQERLAALVQHYFGRTPDAAARDAWDRATRAGLDEIRFAWAGGLERGQRHYYSVLGPTFLLEYDNTQDDANHIHSVWRDLREDFGGDLLAAHYNASAH